MKKLIYNLQSINVFIKILIILTYIPFSNERNTELLYEYCGIIIYEDYIPIILTAYVIFAFILFGRNSNV